jgi:hypothetical protein
VCRNALGRSKSCWVASEPVTNNFIANTLTFAFFSHLTVVYLPSLIVVCGVQTISTVREHETTIGQLKHQVSVNALRADAVAAELQAAQVCAP